MHADEDIHFVDEDIHFADEAIHFADNRCVEQGSGCRGGCWDCRREERSQVCQDRLVVRRNRREIRGLKLHTQEVVRWETRLALQGTEDFQVNLQDKQEHLVCVEYQNSPYQTR